MSDTGAEVLPGPGSRTENKAQEPEEASCRLKILLEMPNQEGQGRVLLGFQPPRWPPNLLQILLFYHIQGETQEAEDLALVHVDLSHGAVVPTETILLHVSLPHTLVLLFCRIITLLTTLV